MNLLLRLLLMLMSASRRGPLTPLQTSSVAMIVWPTDLDVQMHMNNGRYLSLMDLGRIDMLIRSGFAQEARRRGWFPLVGTSLMDYRRPLLVFERYRLQTKLLGWDEKWFVFEQRFSRNGRMMASGLVKATIRGVDGGVSTADALASIGITQPSPALPPQAAALLAARPAPATPGS